MIGREEQPTLGGENRPELAQQPRVVPLNIEVADAKARGEGRRITDDQIEGTSGCLEVARHIRSDETMARIGELVEGEVLASPCDVDL